MHALRVVALVTVSLLAACAATKPRPEITIAIEARNLPPLHAKGDDGNVGFEPDLLDALCEAMQVRCHLIDVPSHRILPGLIDGRFDIALPVERTEERAKVVDFTDPYLLFPYTFLKKKGTEFVSTVDGAAGSTVGVPRLCPEAEQIHKTRDATAYIADRFDGRLKTRPYDMIPRCGPDVPLSALAAGDWIGRQLRDLNAGEIDAIFGSKLVLHHTVILAPGGRRYELTDATFFDFVPGLTMAVRKDRPGLSRDLNAALATIRRDGTYREISRRYFPFDMSG